MKFDMPQSPLVLTSYWVSVLRLQSCMLSCGYKLEVAFRIC